MGTTRLFEASGIVVGPIDLNAPITWGGLRLWQEIDQLNFEIALDVSDVADDGMEALVQRVGPAVRAAIGAACGAAVQVDVLGWSYPAGELRRVGKGLPVRSSVHVGIDTTAEAGPRGQAALEAVLHGADVRLDELYEVYLLGVEAAQTIAPIVGLWGFTTVLEEAALKGEKPGSLLHLPRLISDLRNRGHSVPVAPSSRDPARIRASALHPTPKDPPPTAEEVAWFRDIAHAYLVDRANRVGP